MSEVIPTLFDTRLYRQLSEDGIFKNSDDTYNTFYPFYDYNYSYVYDWHSTPGALDMQIAEAERIKDKTSAKALTDKKRTVEEFVQKNAKQYLASRSLIHPYAIVKIAGASGNEQTVKKQLLFDSYQHRRFYEIDGDDSFSGHYAKNPTTTALIRWGNESDRNKTPYSFQDFVFCKWWNRIENNRMITLRRYAAPVTDNIEFADYETSDVSNIEGESGTTTMKDENGNVVKTIKGSKSKKPWTPLATAVTYFGKDTGNDLSKILKFSAKYNWKELKAKSNPIEVTSSQNEAGAGLVNDSVSGVSSGLGLVARVMGVLGDIKDGKTLNMDAATGVPEDPYSNGPYMNRILGPTNVIMNTLRRERGLEFKQDGLSIVFEYVARPIAGINNKAIIMDLLSNILVLGYSSGSWFGGMWKYRAGSPAMYPWKYGDVMNKLHRGQIFGKDGAIEAFGRNLFSDGKGLIETFIPDVTKMFKGLIDGAINSLGALFGKDDSEKTEEEKEAEKKAKKDKALEAFQSAGDTGTAKTIQKLVAAKITRGTSIPFLRNQRALLTGEPVGDWHLTIGNPFNPIAMIGNLVVRDLNIEFYDELGPDDFPIGFKATIKLDHGLGRDRDAIESMFNRGFGRIYTLPSEFRSSADNETKVDEHTGTDGPRTQYDEIRRTYYGGGTRGIMKTQTGPLQNAGKIYSGDARNIKSLAPNSEVSGKFSVASYYVNPWQMATNL